jgi:hypothetical protein
VKVKLISKKVLKICDALDALEKCGVEFFESKKTGNFFPNDRVHGKEVKDKILTHFE